MKLALHDGFVCGWICNCDPRNAYNDILSRYCGYCNVHRDVEQSYIQLEIVTALRRGVFYAYEQRGDYQYMTNEDRAKLYSKFYNQAYSEALDVTLVSIEALTQQIIDFELIILEAKATKDGKDTAHRERTAKLSKEERDKLITNPTLTTSEGIMVPKVRKDRMTAKDRLAADLAGIMDDDMAASILGTVKVSESAQASSSAKAEIKAKAAGETSFTFAKAGDKVKDEEVKEAPYNPAKITQESLLADLLGRVDLTSTDLKRLLESYSTAALLVGKTVNKLQPDKMILLGSRIAELTAELEAKAVEVKVEKKQEQSIEPSTSTFNVDVSKLFG